MFKLMVTDKKGFDLSALVFDVFEFDSPIGKLKAASGGSATLNVGKGIVFEFNGDFNKQLTTGTVDDMTIKVDGASILDIKELNTPLESLLLLGKTSGAAAIMGFVTDQEDNYVFGNKGADTLLTLGSARYFGGAGNDMFIDASGTINHFDGETGADSVIYTGDSTASVGVTANLADSSKNTGEAAGDTYRSIEGLLGSKFDDTLVGTARANVLLGNDGNDVLVGGAGADKLDGGAGTDYASYDGSLAGVTVNLGQPGQNTEDAKGDTYKNIEGLIGSAQKDTLTGNASDNIIKGGFGDDRIDGGGGNDELWGDKEGFGVDGADTFVFSGPGSASDLRRILDFDVQDHIELSRSGFGLHPLYKLTVGATLIISHADPVATTNSPTFLVEQSTGNLYFDADGNGSGTKELIANVLFHSQEYLDLNDFVIV